MNRKYFWSKERLSDLYLNKNLTIKDIAKQLKVHKSQIRYWLVKYNIPRREITLFVKGHTTNVGKKKSLNTKRKISLSHIGKKVPQKVKDKISLTKRITKCHNITKRKNILSTVK